MPIRPRPPGTPTLDLTTDDSFGVIGDVVFETALAQPAGSGTFNSFEQIQHNGVEQGINTDGAKQFDTKSSAVFNHSLLLSQIPTVVGDGTNGTTDGVVYREFLLDINEPSGSTNAYLSLDALQIWQEEAGNLTGFTPGAGFAGAHTNNLVYNLDAGGDKWIGLNAGLSSGSGQADLAVLVPDSLFINDGTDRFVYLYSAFGVQSGWDAGGGFEEWGTTTPNGPNVTTNAMSISKAASVPGGTVDHAGEVISYTIKVSDVGNTNLTHVIVTDPSADALSLTRGADIVGNNDNVLNPGEIWSFTAQHTVTQAEIDASIEVGVITDTATATSDQTGPVSASASVAVVVPTGPHTSVTVTDTVADGTADSAGEVISYAITVFNDSAFNLTDPLVQEPDGTFTTSVVDGSGFNVGDTNQDGILNPGETWQFTDSYTLTQADLDNRNGGGIPTVDPGLAHSLTVRSVYDQGGPDFATATTPIVQNPHETLTKTASLTAADHAGEVISYAISLTNDGNMNLTNATVTDPTVSNFAAVMSGGFNVGDTNLDGELSLGETWQYTANHTVTQAEIDNGGVVDPSLAFTNTASATSDQGATSTSTASVAITQNPQVTLTKTATVADGAADEVGDVINYAISLTNTGNMTLTSPVVSDPSVSDLAGVISGGFNVGDSNHDGKLGLGETWQYTADHTVTQADIDNGGVVDPTLAITNTASASTAQGASATASASVPVTQSPHVTMAKAASLADGGTTADAAGDVINYAISVTNDGNMTLTNPVVSDPSVSDLAPVMQAGHNAGDTNHDDKLSVGETWQYTASHTVTQAEIDNGGVVDPNLAFANTASASTDQGASASATASVPVTQSPSMSLSKSGTFNDANSDGFAEVGETISYTFTETNTGNMTLNGVTVTDSGITVSGSAIGSLAPGASDATTFTGTYTITQADIDAGSKDNTATATSDNATSAPATAHVVLPQNPHVSLSETASDANSPPAAGDSLVYTFQLANDGNVTLHDPTVSDTATSGVTAETSGGFNVGDVNNNLLFDPGETWSFTGTRTLSADDIAHGVADTSTGSALGPQNQATNTAMASFTFPHA